MFEPWNDPTYLTRIWCIYEFYTAQDIGCPVTIIMPPREKEVLVDELLDGLDRLYDALSKTKIQNAQATYEEDRQTILQMIERSVGYNALNNAVNHCLRSWVRNVIDEIIDDYFKRGEGGNSSELNKDNEEYDESCEADLLYSIGNFLTNVLLFETPFVHKTMKQSCTVMF